MQFSFVRELKPNKTTTITKLTINGTSMLKFWAEIYLKRNQFQIAKERELRLLIMYPHTMNW